MDQNQREQVRCVKCSRVDEYPAGYLTEQAKREYLCSVHREAVLERGVQEAESQGKELLTEG
jgi:hypothetical protein